MNVITKILSVVLSLLQYNSQQLNEIYKINRSKTQFIDTFVFLSEVT